MHNAAPFTSGGSILGMAAWAGSLSEIGSGIAATTAAIVGAALADARADDILLNVAYRLMKESGVPISEHHFLLCS